MLKGTEQQMVSLLAGHSVRRLLVQCAGFGVQGVLAFGCYTKFRFQSSQSIRLRATTSTSGSGWLCRVEGVGCRCQGTERQVCMVTDHCVNRLLQGWGCRVEDVSFRVGGVWFWV